MNIPSLPLAELADAAIDFLVETCAPFTRAGAEVVSALLDIFEHGLLACPPWLFIPLLCGITWLLTRRLPFSLRRRPRIRSALEYRPLDTHHRHACTGIGLYGAVLAHRRRPRHSGRSM